jgi:hypothetical protein
VSATAQRAASVRLRRGPGSRNVLTLGLAALFIILFSIGLLNISQSGHQLSVVDEHIHFDTAARATQGTVPWLGMKLGDEVVQEWACGVGHEGGGLPYACGDARLDSSSLPSGEYSTGYGHYPTYFFAAAAFHSFWSAVSGSEDFLSSFRAFSALTLILGVFVCGVFAWLLGLRGAGFLAATAIPVASSMVVFTATIVNPSSTAVLAGALIAGTGLLWVKRDRGFVWFALAVAFAGCIAVTDILPAGGFCIAALVVLLARARGRQLTPGWSPRWWQLAASAAIILAPVIIWGRVIAARATVTNDVLYDFIPESGRQDIVVGAITELSALHTPWRETNGIQARPDDFITRAIHAFSIGAPTWITVLIIGAVVFAMIISRKTFVGVPFTTGAAADSAHVWKPGATDLRFPTSALMLVGIGTLATLVLYPPALRVSNWVTFGFDYGIVDRYSNALTVILALLAILLLRRRAFHASIAAIGMVTAIGVVAAGL